MFRDERELGVVHFFGFCGKNIVFMATGFQFPIRCEPAIKLIKWLPNIIKLHTLCCVMCDGSQGSCFEHCSLPGLCSRLRDSLVIDKEN